MACPAQSSLSLWQSPVRLLSLSLSLPLTDCNKNHSFFLLIGGNNLISVSFYSLVKGTLQIWISFPDKEQEEGGPNNFSLSFCLYLIYGFTWTLGNAAALTSNITLSYKPAFWCCRDQRLAGGTLAKWRWQRVHMCMSVRFQRGSGKTSVWARSDTSEQPKRPR